MTSPIAETLSGLMAQTRSLYEVCPVSYLRRLNEAITAQQFYAAASDLCNAANSKELRDGAEDIVHFWCGEIWSQFRALREALTIRLVPATPQQHEAWRNSIARATDGEYRFAREGILEAIVLDVALHGTLLRITRRWVHGGKTGVSARFDIALDPFQTEHLRTRLAAAVEMQTWLDGRCTR